MSDPTNPADPKEEASTADSGADTAVPAAEPSAVGTTAATQTGDTATGDTQAGDRPAGDAAAGDAAAGDVKTAVAGEDKKTRRSRAPWVTVGAAVVVLLALAVLGYVWGLGPMSRLNAERSITPPAKLAGLDRITDPEIRSRAQLDQTREALSRINDGKKVTVEAYGSLDGDRFYVLIALRGRVDIDKVVADSGASADKVKKIGQSTCIESAGNLPTQCYRGSNTLTVIAQSANEGVSVDQVAPVAEEAYKAMG
jgi:hypothetical protein